MKSIFKSKTAALALLTTLAGIAATFYPEASDLIAANAGTILIGLGIVNLLLRKLTKGKVVLFPSK